MSRLARLAAPLLLAFGMMTTAAPGQEDLAPLEGEATAEGNPMYGYVATAFLSAGAIFVLCWSSRR